MTYNDFYGWVRDNRVLAVPLILLFIFGTIFQVTDTFERVKGWFTPETHNILHVQSPVEYLGEDGGLLNQADGDEEVFHQFSLTTKADQNEALIQALLTGNNDVWLVRIEGTDVIAPQSAGDTGENNSGLYIGLTEDIPFAMDIQARDGETALSINIQFPNINPDHPWTDFETTPQTCCYGDFKHTAFYRFVEYRDKGQLPHMRLFKAQYIEPDADLAKTLLKEIETGKYKHLYFHPNTPDN